MTRASDPSDLHLRCGEVLHYIWDPIGVAGQPGARDEYDTYVPEVVAMLHAGAELEALVTHLERLARFTMGLGGTRASAERAAEVLLDWREALVPPIR